MAEPRWLDIRDVLRLHAALLDAYGGASGIRDLGLLLSALKQSRAMFDGQFLHRDHHEMAAAYLVHLVRNHPFLDGNKRLGAATAIVLLDLNEIQTLAGEATLVAITLGVARGTWSKSDVAAALRGDPG